MPAPSLARPIAWTALHAVLWGLVVVASAAVVPRFERLFKDFGVDLPSATLAVIRVSHVVAPAVLPASLAVILLLAIDFGVIRSAQQGKAVGVGWWIAGMTAAPLFILLVGGLAIGTVWLSVMDRLRG